MGMRCQETRDEMTNAERDLNVWNVNASEGERDKQCGMYGGKKCVI